MSTRSKIPTEVFETQSAHFDQCGQFLYYPLRKTNKKINQKLAKRIVGYAKKRMKEMGLLHVIEEWSVIVGTLNGNDDVESRTYYVEWSNPEKTKISLSRILIKDGSPFIDYGIQIEAD